MKKMIKILIIGLVLVFTLSSCKKVQGSGSKNTKGVEQEKVIKVAVEEVVREDLKLFSTFSGKLDGKTDIVVYSEVAGKVLKINKKLGAYIKKGEEIASLDQVDYKIKLDMAKADLLSSQAQYEAAGIKYETTEKLYKKGNISKLEYITDKSSLLKAEAGVQNSMANLEKAEKNFANARFIAPVFGYITELNVENGEFIGNGKPVCSIVDYNKLIIKTGVSEQDIKKLKNGQKVEILHSSEEVAVSGNISGFGIKPNGSGVYPVEIELDNKEKILLPGMVVEGKIFTGTLADVISIDYDNLIQAYGRYYLFVISKENRVEKRRVYPGKRIGERVVISKGLDSGDKIVVSNIEQLKNGIKVSTIDKNLLTSK